MVPVPAGAGEAVSQAGLPRRLPAVPGRLPDPLELLERASRQVLEAASSLLVLLDRLDSGLDALGSARFGGVPGQAGSQAARQAGGVPGQGQQRPGQPGRDGRSGVVFTQVNRRHKEGPRLAADASLFHKISPGRVRARYLAPRLEVRRRVEMT